MDDVITERLLRVAGTFAAGIIAVSMNVLVQRNFVRWDVTSSRIYTLSTPTLETLRGLTEPIDVIVFLSASDPLLGSVQHLLDAYGAETRMLRVRSVDPDRSPAEFLAMQKEHGIVAGKTEDGRVVTDAAIVLSRGGRRWYVTTDDMVVYDAEDERARPVLEQALTEGLRNVLARDPVHVCFTTGHQELSPDDGGPRGLAELKHRIRKDNYETRRVDLTSPDPAETLSGCRLVVVAGPELAFSAGASRRVEEHLLGGGSALFLLNPILDEGDRIRATGLERAAGLFGVELGLDLVVERDAESRLTQGQGESFLTTPRTHPVTAGLVDDDRPRLRPLLTMAQSIRVVPEGLAQPL
ncbi:MAG: GldG family protein, partial [Deltaproteobacteria bacterium]|nr:GldG family protein [Deltaproteobacteria bacterium]